MFKTAQGSSSNSGGVPKPVAKTRRRFLGAEGGNVAVLFSLSAVTIMAVGGGAIDYGRASWTATSLQSAIDGAVLAGIASSTIEDHQLAVATKYFNASKPATGDIGTPAFVRSGKRLIGTASGTVSTTLLGIIGIESLPVKAKGVATAEVSREPICIMAMHDTRKHTLEMKGQVSLFGPECHIYGNSDHFNDVVDPHTPHNFITAKSVAAVGGGHHYLENVTPPVEFGHEIIPDPFAAYAIPAKGGCVETNLVISNSTRTLATGHYCGGLQISNSNVTLQSGGVYHVSGGSFDIAASTLTGDRVTIFLSDAATSIDWTDSTIRLKAPTSGGFAGVALFGKQVPTSNSFENSTVDIHGTFYMPSGEFEWTNEGTPNITALWTTFVTDGFSWNGKGTINFPFDLASSDVPYPAALRLIPRPGKVRLTE